MERTGATAADTPGFGRIVAFTDGVFAIAITLLVLNLDVPDLPSGQQPKLSEFLNDSWADLGAYFLTFAVVGRFWVIHHRLFSSLHSFDRWLMNANLAYLSLIVLVPFPAELLGSYGDRSVAAVIYAAVLGSAALVHWVMVRHSVAGGHVHPDRHGAAAPYGERQELLVPLVFYGSIPLALLSPLAAELSWVAMQFARPLWRRSRR